MTNSKDSNNDRAHKEYDRAISLMQYHISLLWEQFGVFLIAETVLIGFLGAALAQEDTIIGRNWLVFLGAILGLVLCLPWWSTYLHNYKYYQLRIEQAKRHEKELGIALFTEGEKLSSSGLTITNGKKLRHSWLARILPPRKAFSLLILVFSIVFSALITIAGPWYR